MLNGWNADTDHDALDPWHYRSPDAGQRPGLDPGLLRAMAVVTPLCLLLWAGLVGGLIWWLR